MGSYSAVVVFGLSMLAACGRLPEPEPPDPTVEPAPEPVPEPTPDPTTGASCQTACANQRKLGCEISTPTTEGTTCEEVCEGSFNAGIKDLEWKVDELTSSEKCEE